LVSEVAEFRLFAVSLAWQASQTTLSLTNIARSNLPIIASQFVHFSWVPCIVWINVFEKADVVNMAS
jgi:hypothetical protein